MTGRWHFVFLFRLRSHLAHSPALWRHAHLQLDEKEMSPLFDAPTVGLTAFESPYCIWVLRNIFFYPLSARLRGWLPTGPFQTWHRCSPPGAHR
jgi:hypothetical protein